MTLNMRRMMQIRALLLSTLLMLTLSSCAQSFTALEQQQISIEDPALFEKSGWRVANCASW